MLGGTVNVAHESQHTYTPLLTTFSRSVHPTLLVQWY